MLQRVKTLSFVAILSFYSQAFSDVNPAFKVLMMADPQAFRVCEEKFAQRCPANAICWACYKVGHYQWSCPYNEPQSEIDC